MHNRAPKEETRPPLRIPKDPRFPGKYSLASINFVNEYKTINELLHPENLRIHLLPVYRREKKATNGGEEEEGVVEIREYKPPVVNREPTPIPGQSQPGRRAQSLESAARGQPQQHFQQPQQRRPQQPVQQPLYRPQPQPQPQPRPMGMGMGGFNQPQPRFQPHPGFAPRSAFDDLGMMIEEPPMRAGPPVIGFRPEFDRGYGLNPFDFAERPMQPMQPMQRVSFFGPQPVFRPMLPTRPLFSGYEEIAPEDRFYGNQFPRQPEVFMERARLPPQDRLYPSLTRSSVFPQRDTFGARPAQPSYRGGFGGGFM
eukprot:TRINITY_DN1742_c0_g1_i4.p1 TRINITY_DN1742_c0_g1~~TRINITY_DN1742_c0_g1_i4.p1  ORF type:complete len:312 (-),score=96.14 TRINITY_DN1742_c0_g1_i4:146-1081(-)